jgi:hypothetical protein
MSRTTDGCPGPCDRGSPVLANLDTRSVGATDGCASSYRTELIHDEQIVQSAVKAVIQPE